MKWFDTVWERAKAIIELSMPWLIALLFAATYWEYLLVNLPPRNFAELLQASLNVAAIGIGFLISAKAILLSITNSRIVKKLRIDGSFGQLIGYFISATWWSSWLAFYSAALLWGDLSTTATMEKRLLVLFWMFLCGGAIGSVLRVIWLFTKLVRRTANEGGEPPHA